LSGERDGILLTAGRPWKLFQATLEKALAGAKDVIDVGTDQRFSKELRPLVSMFDGKNYLAAGYQPEQRFGIYNCDLHLDVCNIALPDKSQDCVICIEVLEHCVNPMAAAGELIRILRPGGALFLTVPFLSGFHGHSQSQSGAHSDYPDFWRFTHQGLGLMFASLSELEVQPLDGPIEFRVRSTPLVRAVDKFPTRQLLDYFDRPRPGKATTRHLVYGRNPMI
jgi:SAM-dependent methyltransferase